jgi:hemerythrin-like domain-containing protein
LVIARSAVCSNRSLAEGGKNVNPMEILAKEHGLISEALDSCRLARQQMEEGSNPPAEFFEKMVEFARTFVDKRHHFKEEYLMFGKLAAKHHSELDGEIEALRQQHDHGREFVSEMANALDGYSRGKDAQVTIMLENLAPYTTMLRHHILREDRVFYPMVEEVLAQEEMDDLAELYTKEDERHGTMEGMQALVQELRALV